MLGNSSLFASTLSCLESRATFSNQTALLITYVLLLMPFFLYVLWLSCQRWWKRAVSSHSDVFTLNMVSLELVGICGFFLCYYGTHWGGRRIMAVGLYVTSFILPGQTLFPLLTCVDLYLAAAHPITYMGLKQSSGVLIRNVSVACVWLLGVVCSAQTFSWDVYFTSNVVFLSFSFSTISFCCFSVLVVLIRPGPGEAGGVRKRADPSKQRAFFTITAVMGALFVQFCAVLSFCAVMTLPAFRLGDYCLIMLLSVWFSLPSSVVLPLLFLHRAGKLALPKKILGFRDDNVPQ